MSSFLLDLRQATRALARHKTFALAAILTLALAIGANTAIFSLVQAVLLRPLPLEDPASLVQVFEANPGRGRTQNVVNPGNFLSWRERSTSFAGMAGFAGWAQNLAGEGEPERLQVGSVTSDFFGLLGAKPALGRLIEEGDGRDDAERVVVLSDGLWRRRFAARPDVLGQEVRIEGRVATVIGVAEPGFALPTDAELWTALRLGPDAREARGRWMSVVARLKPGVELETARQEMATVAAALAKEYPQRNESWSATVFPLHEIVVGKLQNALAMLFGAVGLVLLIACANVAGLLLARAASRQRELAVRQALGADRRRLVTLALAESLPLALAGGLLGLALAQLFLRVFLALSPIDLPRHATLRLDAGALAFTAAVALFCAFASSLGPALRGVRQDVSLLRTSGLGTRQPRGRSALVMAEVAVSVVLLAGASLLIRSFDRLAEVDPGFEVEKLLTFQLSLPVGDEGSSWRDPNQLRRIFRELEGRLTTLPGVENAGGISWLPLGGGGAATGYHPLDRPEPAPGEKAGADIRIVTPQLLATLGVPLRQGRFFDDRDQAGAPERALISEGAARELWPDQDPLGRKLRVAWGSADGEPEIDVEIVGVVGEVRLSELATAPRATLYFAQEQVPSRFMSFALRTDQPISALAGPLRSVIAEVDADLPMANLAPMDQVLDRGLRSARFSATLLAALAGLALLLAAVGLYGLIAQRVAQSGRELGLRLALGATPGRLFAGVLGDGARLVAIGLAIGLGGALAFAQALRSELYQTPTLDLGAYAATLGLLFVAALIALAIPAWRATRVPPMEALRAE